MASLTDCGHIEDGADDGHQQDGAQVVEEHAIRHKVARIQNYRRQHIEEEGVRCEWGDGNVRAKVEHNAYDHAHDNQQTGFRKYQMQLGCHVKA